MTNAHHGSRWIAFLLVIFILSGSVLSSFSGAAEAVNENNSYHSDHEDAAIPDSDDPSDVLSASQSAQQGKQQVLAAASAGSRATVLILDNSVSMAGKPLTALKNASKKFCNELLASGGNNTIAIIIYDTKIVNVCDFTSNIDLLTSAINGMDGKGGWTNIGEAAKQGYEMLKSADAEIKNLVIMTDGLPTYGSSARSGQYNKEDIDVYYNYTNHYIYEFANSLYTDVTAMFKDLNIYTLGYFHNMSKYQKTFGEKLLKDIQNAGYYEVTDADELVFAFGEIADDISNNTRGQIQKLTFTYGGKSKIEGDGDRNYTARCYYTDDYFSHSAYTYQESLATMTLALAMSAFSCARVDYEYSPLNAIKLMKDIGCDPDSIDYNSWFTKKPTNDSIAVIVGNKHIIVDKKPYTLLAVAIRGSGYESEWASDFTVGKTGQHQGFREAKEEVIRFLQYYVAHYQIKGNVKIWITGYSRGAATANLVAGELDELLPLSSEVEYTPDDVYAYCFETPAGLDIDVSDGWIYANIYNIINDNDPVPYLAPSALGFGRYGIDYHLPSIECDGQTYKKKKDKMYEIYKSLQNTGDYLVDNFKMKRVGVNVKSIIYPRTEIEVGILDDEKNDIPQSLFLKDFSVLLAHEYMINREHYVKYYQNEIREIFSILYRLTPQQQRVIETNFMEILSDEWPNVLISLVNPFDSREKTISIIVEWLERCFKETLI